MLLLTGKKFGLLQSGSTSGHRTPGAESGSTRLPRSNFPFLLKSEMVYNRTRGCRMRELYISHTESAERNITSRPDSSMMRSPGRSSVDSAKEMQTSSLVSIEERPPRRKQRPCTDSSTQQIVERL